MLIEDFEDFVCQGLDVLFAADDQVVQLRKTFFFEVVLERVE